MRFLPLIPVLLLVSGCAVSNAPPVIDVYGQDARADKVASGSHRVREGETLYSIAWRYGWDYRDLARANNIAAPYTIYPGQVVAFSANGATTSADASSPVPVSSPGDEQSGTSQATSVAVASPTHPKPTSSTRSQPPSQQKNAVERSPSPATSGPLRWQWPAEGKLSQRFGSSGADGRGIAISGQQGSAVVAAAAGQVVYRGSGLTGYGNLIIIKHNDRWLSAYAHNQKMLVKEGEKVKAGQKIATMGASGTYRTQLHFEIRKDGKPVDPLSVLPDR